MQLFYFKTETPQLTYISAICLIIYTCQLIATTYMSLLQLDHLLSCSILFADIVSFTELTGELGSRELVSALNQLFGRFDHLAKVYLHITT